MPWLRLGVEAEGPPEAAGEMMGSQLPTSNFQTPNPNLFARELKEANFRLRVLRQTGILLTAHDPVINESAELVKILAALVRNTAHE